MGTISSPQPNVPRSEDAAVLLGTGVHAGRSASGRTGGRSKFQRIAVFCGASDGASPCFAEAAVALGKEMAARRIQLVYGGGSVGLMGVVYEALGEGSVIGVIPEALQPREVSGPAVGEVRVVEDMHMRKAMMAAEADAFIALPGGFGTLEEILEMVTWQQLGFHGKPVGFLNAGGFYDHLLKFFDNCVESGFVRQRSRDIVVHNTDPAALLDALEAYEAPPSIVQLARDGKLSANMRG